MAAILPLLVAAAGLLLFLVQRSEFKRRVPLLLLWLPSLINISALYWGLIYRVRYSVLLLPAVAIFGSLVTTSHVAKKRSLLLLLVVVMGLPWFTWYMHHTNPSSFPLPGPGALVLPVVGLILFFIARVKQWYSAPLMFMCVAGMNVPPLAREVHPMMVETMEHEFIEPEREKVLQY
jgi:phosphoglycerol transferase MdoB-like AlkP superfamily enzyme